MRDRIAATRAFSADVRERAARMREQSRRIQSRIHRSEVVFDPRLSSREREVLALIGGGITTKEMAQRLGISPNTVNYHIANVYRKLGTNGRVTTANAYHRMLLARQPTAPG